MLHTYFIHYVRNWNHDQRYHMVGVKYDVLHSICHQILDIPEISFALIQCHCSNQQSCRSIALMALARAQHAGMLFPLSDKTLPIQLNYPCHDCALPHDSMQQSTNWCYPDSCVFSLSSALFPLHNEPSLIQCGNLSQKSIFSKNVLLILKILTDVKSGCRNFKVTKWIPKWLWWCMCSITTFDWWN